MLIRGAELNIRQRVLVLSAFSYRWTHENPSRKSVWSRVRSGMPLIPLQTDEQWLREHAFHFVRDGSRLSARHRFCEPHYVADS
ncbi:MAG: hypothetical protein HY290_23685 [Planctomycetia bacterium]|nr:hypothetical protein [Planctomycetia bacterium]